MYVYTHLHTDRERAEKEREREKIVVLIPIDFFAMSFWRYLILSVKRKALLPQLEEDWRQRQEEWQNGLIGWIAVDPERPRYRR